jgi:ABC-type multidrug transport system ATPase subunit
MWDVIRGLIADGATLLLTTQYLEEADQLADEIVVIDHGRAIARGTAAELKAQTGGATVHITLPEPADDATLDALSWLVTGEIQVGPGARDLTAPVDLRSGLATDVVRALDRSGVVVDDVEVRKPSLDDVFFALTADAVPEPDSDPNATETPEPMEVLA